MCKMYKCTYIYIFVFVQTYSFIQLSGTSVFSIYIDTKHNSPLCFAYLETFVFFKLGHNVKLM